MHARFLTREQVADELYSVAQAYAVIRRKDLRAMKVGGRGTRRIGRDDLEDYFSRMYVETERWIQEHPFTEGDQPPEEPW